MAINESYKNNFETLKRAVRAQGACLLEARRKADGQIVALLCAVNDSPGNPEYQYEFVPLAVMIEGNPYELFEPPDPKGGFYQELEGGKL